MQTPGDASAYSIDGKLYAQLASAAAEAASLPEGEQRTWALRGVASFLVGSPETFRAALFKQFPELAAAEPIPDSYLVAREQEAESCITPADFEALDSALIGGALTSWRKVSRVIADAMVTLEGQLQPLPIGVYVRRVELLAKAGKLEARGDVQFMRSGEVRLPENPPSAG
jgi:hypothetical protein